MELTKPLVDLNDVEYHIRQWLDKNDGGVGRIDANFLVNYLRSRLKLSHRENPQPQERVTVIRNSVYFDKSLDSQWYAPTQQHANAKALHRAEIIRAELARGGEGAND